MGGCHVVVDVRPKPTGSRYEWKTWRKILRWLKVISIGVSVDSHIAGDAQETSELSNVIPLQLFFFNGKKKQ